MYIGVRGGLGAVTLDNPNPRLISYAAWNRRLIDTETLCFCEIGKAALTIGYQHGLNACETTESHRRCAKYVHIRHVMTPLSPCVRDTRDK
jgi:hypothetical protein